MKLSHNSGLYLGTEGDDTHRAGSRDNTLYGLGGDDNLGGGKGNDIINLGAGNDTVNGGKGDDTITTGEGNDLIKFNEKGGADVVTDFNRGLDHVLLNIKVGSNHVDDFQEFVGFLQSGAIQFWGDGTAIRLTFDNGDSLELQGINNIQAQDWQFA
jgi:Ca2+-binding RTX toxin-like protein